MLTKIHRWFAHLSSYLTVGQAIAGTSVLGAGVITGWLSTGVEWINQFGAFGWWCAGLIGALGATLVLGSFAWLRYLWMKASAIKHWRETARSDAINPLDAEFNHKRIKFHDLTDPTSYQITDKRFTDCELLGPANIVMRSHVRMLGNNFIHCDFIVGRPDGKVRNAIGLINVEVIGGSIWNATIFMPPGMLPDFKDSAIRFVTYTGDPEFDKPYTD